MKLNKQKTLVAIREKIAEPLKMTEVEAASGIYRIANSHMSDLIRKATVEKGHDPRNFVLFAFGGAASGAREPLCRGAWYSPGGYSSDRLCPWCDRAH